MPESRTHETIIIPPSCQERLLPLQSRDTRSLLEHDIFLAGISDLRGRYFVDRTNVPFHLLLYTVAGKGKARVANDSIYLEPGEMLLAPSGTSYSYIVDQAPWVILWFHLQNSALWSHVRELPAGKHPGKGAADLHGLMDKLLEESLSEQHGADRVARHLSELLVIYLERDLASDESPTARRFHERLHTLWSYVESNPQHDWTVQSLADRMNMSVSHFHRVVMRHEGVSPKQMVTHIRMRQAEDLLLNRDLPLKVIAPLLGYRTSFAFSVAFKRHAGLSPRDFRQRAPGRDT